MNENMIFIQNLCFEPNVKDKCQVLKLEMSFFGYKKLNLILQYCMFLLPKTCFFIIIPQLKLYLSPQLNTYNDFNSSPVTCLSFSHFDFLSDDIISDVIMTSYKIWCHSTILSNKITHEFLTAANQFERKKEN